MRLKIILICFLFAIKISGQTELPDVNDLGLVPKSPEATAFIKYGNLESNLYTGTPNISIPIYTIKGREMNFPISLSYDASGIKVEQLATWVGLGWNLNIGGAVTRTINGQADDEAVTGLPSYKKHYQQDVKSLRELYLGGINENQDYEVGYAYDYKFNFEREVLEQRMDIYPDKFNFSVNGFSGEFFIDYQNNKGVCINNPSVKIVPIFNDLSSTNYANKIITGFVITDETGVKYEFNRPEKTVSRLEFTGGARTINTYYSAWQLTKITSKSKKDVLQFVFSNNDINWFQQKVPRDFSSITVNPATLDFQGGSITPGGIVSNSMSPNITYVNTTFNLERILLNNKEIITIETKLEDRIDIPGGRNALKSLMIIDNSTLTNKINFYTSYFLNDFTSDPVEYRNRLKLDRIEIGLDQTKDYKFEYIGMDDYGNCSLPSRLSKDQDYWGYYNNANNTNLIPKSELSVIVNGGGLNFGGNRNTNSDVNIVGLGTLNKITYPTGGYNKFNYQVHNLPQEVIPTPIEDYSLFIQNFVGEVSLTDTYNSIPCYDFGFNAYPIGQQLNYFNVEETGDYNIKIDTEFIDPGDDSIRHDPMTFLAIFPENYVGNSDFCALYNNNNIPFSKLNPDGTYTVHLDQNTLYYGLFLSNHPGSTSNVLFDFNINGLKIITKYIGGLRINEIENFTDSEVKIASKKYIYDDISSLDFSTFNFEDNKFLSTAKLHTPNNFTEQITKKYFGVLECSGANSFTVDGIERSYEKRYSDNLSTQMNNHIAYSKVSEIFYENEFINSLNVTSFHNNLYYLNYFTFNKSATNILNGKIEELNSYNKLSKIVSKNTYSYDIINNGLLPSEMMFRSTYIYQGSSWVYSYTNEWNEIKERFTILDPNICGSVIPLGFINTTPSFFNPVIIEERINEGNEVNRQDFIFNHNNEIFLNNINRTNAFNYFYDSNNNLANTTETETNYFYDNNNHRQITKTETTSSQNETLITEIDYAHDLLGQEPLMQNLIDANRIAEPIQTKSFLNNTSNRLSHQLTKYTLTNDNLLLPEIIQTSKASNSLEDRIIYHRYDNKGNPIEVSKKDGQPILYIWGYNQSQPIAKIVNATFNDISAYISDLQAKSNSDNDRTVDIINGSNISYQGNEGVLRNALHDLRMALSDAMITSFTYDPLIGVTSITNPTGQIQYFYYDNSNRLQYVKDSQGNILSKNEYHYRPQN